MKMGRAFGRFIIILALSLLFQGCGESSESATSMEVPGTAYETGAHAENGQADLPSALASDATEPQSQGNPVENERSLMKPVYVLMQAHIEGDIISPPGSPIDNYLFYQTLAPPPPGRSAQGPTFAMDCAGTNLCHELTKDLRDRYGVPPKWFWNPVGEFWQTESDNIYGSRLFAKYDFLSLGHEFGIQGHPAQYSGQNFCWQGSPHTKEGIERKFKDMNYFANRTYNRYRKVNKGLTYCGGWKIEKDWLGLTEAESIIDHAAYALGYRISFEDHNGHMKDEPPGFYNSSSCHYVYEARYGDGVSIIKLDMNGSLTCNPPPGTISEDPWNALNRLDMTLAARAQDPDPKRIYYFGFVVHPEAIWADYNMQKGGVPMIGEGKALSIFLPMLANRLQKGAPIVFVTPSTLADIYRSR